MAHFIYLHGLASGPNSQKATAFKKIFCSLDLHLHIPDLEKGSFENLTISSQFKMVKSIINKYPNEPFGLIGSSLGGYLAALVAELCPEVVAAYLMAPAFGFLKRWREKIDQKYGVEKFPEFIDIFHFRYNENRTLNTKIFKDAELWESVILQRELPLRIVHGSKDESVPVYESKEISKNRPNINFSELDSDHGLLSHLDWIINDCICFFRKERLV